MLRYLLLISLYFPIARAWGVPHSGIAELDAAAVRFHRTGDVLSEAGFHPETPTGGAKGEADSIRLTPSPNPASGLVVITISLPRSMRTSLTVVDQDGRTIARLGEGVLGAGEHRIQWLTDGIPSGRYNVRLRAGEFVVSRKLVIIQ